MVDEFPIDPHAFSFGQSIGTFSTYAQSNRTTIINSQQSIVVVVAFTHRDSTSEYAVEGRIEGISESCTPAEVDGEMDYDGECVDE